MAKISVFGAGTWGLAIAILLDQNGHDVTVWALCLATISLFI